MGIVLFKVEKGLKDFLKKRISRTCHSTQKKNRLESEARGVSVDSGLILDLCWSYCLSLFLMMYILTFIYLR